MSHSVEITSITASPKALFKVTKALKTKGFKIEPFEFTEMGKKEIRYQLTKTFDFSAPAPDKVPRLKTEPLGVYKNLVTFMLMTTLTDLEWREVMSILSSVPGDVFRLGVDGGWLGFSYYLVYLKSETSGLLQNMESGLSEMDNYFDSLTTQHGVTYSPEIRQLETRKSQDLVNSLKKEFKL